MQMNSAQPVFKLELNHKVSPGIVIVAKYDGTHPCLTASAGYDKVRNELFGRESYRIIIDEIIQKKLFKIF